MVNPHLITSNLL